MRIKISILNMYISEKALKKLNLNKKIEIKRILNFFFQMFFKNFLKKKIHSFLFLFLFCFFFIFGEGAFFKNKMDETKKKIQKQNLENKLPIKPNGCQKYQMLPEKTKWMHIYIYINTNWRRSIY